MSVALLRRFDASRKPISASYLGLPNHSTGYRFRQASSTATLALGLLTAAIMAGTPVTLSPEEEARKANRARFELELEFVQALANPYYLHSLAQQNILSQPAFINFLAYLLYWKEKDYARFIQ